ncbi:Lin0512 family protein [Bacillus sp. MRMR6]|uniref:Lin0512 family protein n=1 Tax=Bacillus sp. MRMR6 TaxID=1928617 RepID=UPI0009529E8C|nr:Lin0512 family protein [Bacillus sp. MRMR6]OLS33770.1 hypothetical protein BTR25_24040 [Bacillus sp. MRMR6]
MYKRYIVELGTGVDLHGIDVNKAAKKAVNDAVSHGCLCGLVEILSITDTNKSIKIDVLIASPYPERIDTEEIKREIPFGKVNIEVKNGGLEVKGVSEESFGPGDKIVMVNASLTVNVDVD